MEEAVVGSVVGATIQVVLQNLLSISVEDISLFLSSKKDLENLKSVFLTIHDFLDDAQMKQVNNKAVKRWLMKLEAVAYDAENVLDELNYELLRKKMETAQNMKTKSEKVRSFFSHSNPFARHVKLSYKIMDINKKLEMIKQEASNFGLQMTLAVAHAPASVGLDPLSESLETDSLIVDPVIFGRENDMTRIIKMLTNISLNEQVLSVLPIVGMGGLGKTTLARQVYGDRKIKGYFGNCIWVHVSSHFDVNILFKNILASLKIENVEHGNREALLKKLHDVLGAKRYLLVLDDVWNDDQEKWESVISSLSGISSNGSVVIVTTRCVKVASIVGTLPIHELGSLSEDNCWSIIKAKAFRASNIPLEFESIRETIAKRCQGLPLAAKVVGGLLRNKSIDGWISIEKNWLSNIGDGNTVSKILKLSFDHLSSAALKECFAYCSIFPKGFHVKREQLIELWMAEGLLQADQRNDMEMVGNQFFNCLLQNSLIQAAERDAHGNITYCYMHDLVHDLAYSVLSPKRNDNNLDDINQVRHIVLQSSSDESHLIQKKQLKHLRTMLYNAKVFYLSFSSFKCLHVLILMSDGVRVLSETIRELIHLRCLDISYTRIKCLPDSIGELYHLQTIRAVKEKSSDKNYLGKLPDTLKYLISLRHLHIPRIELPPGMGQLTYLQTLQYFHASDERGRGIVELGSLKNLKGKLEIYDLEKVRDKEEAESACLFQKHNVFELKFVWKENRIDGINDENVLEGLQPHPNLKSLEIHGFKSTRFPLWTMKMAIQDHFEGWLGLTNLMDIRLSCCSECEEIPMLGHLPHLKSLHLCNLTNVESIGSSFYGINNCGASSSSDNGVWKETIIVFPSLEKLKLSGMSNLIEWMEVEPPSRAETQLCEVMVFPRLEHLKIERCTQLMRSPSNFPCLTDLEICDMHSSLPLQDICGETLNSLTKLKIEGVVGLVSLPNGLLHKNQEMSLLEIRYCPNLTLLVPRLLGGGGSYLKELTISHCQDLIKLPDDLHNLNSLECLNITHCPNLGSIAYDPSGGSQSQGFASLRHLAIIDCERLINLPREMLISRDKLLETLRLSQLSSLTNLPMIIGYLREMPRLTFLEITEVPKLFEFDMENIGSLDSLHDLSIGNYFSDSLDNVSSVMVAQLDGIFFRGGMRSLRRLWLYGMEHWDSLPNQLQHLTNLSLLQLKGFGIEALPEWLGNLSSLKNLHLYDCKKLRCLPSMEAIQRLTKLTRLVIQDCPLGDSEYLKISHIPHVDVLP